MKRYDWLVLAAAWLGWGFDVFDAILFNYVAPTCVPLLLGLPLGSAEAHAAAVRWTGVMALLLLVGWAAGGFALATFADSIGRARSLSISIWLYSLGTVLAALAPNLGWLLACRALSSIGVGGEWAIGATLVAEVVPERRRVEAGALLYTAAPLGLLLAGAVVHWTSTGLFPDNPGWAWRASFLFALFPCAVAGLVRSRLREPARWSRHERPIGALRELLSGASSRATISGFTLALVATFTASALAIWSVFGGSQVLYLSNAGFFILGLAVFGVFGSFTYYLPELFPTRLRATGAAFCYNSVRVLAALGPVVLGRVAASDAASAERLVHSLCWVRAAPVCLHP